MAPAAPARPIRPTRSKTAATPSKATEQLIETFDSLLISDPPASRTASVKPVTKPRTIGITRAPIASTSNLTKTKTTTGRALVKPIPSIKGKEKEVTTLSDSELANEAMKVINLNLKSLSATNKSGWKLSTATKLKPIVHSTSSVTNPTPLVTKEQVSNVAETCGTALSQLRSLIGKGNIRNRLTDAEKAAGSLIANLVELELVRFYPFLLLECTDCD